MRLRLALIVGATTALVTIAFVLPLALTIRYLEQQDEIDGVERSATAFAALVDNDAAAADIERAIERFETIEPGIALTVYERDGAILGAASTPDDHVVAAFDEGAVIVEVGEGVHVYVPNHGPFDTADASNFVIRLDAPRDVIEFGVRRLALVLVGSTVAAAVIGSAAGAIAGRSIGRPAERLTETARRLQHGDLDARAVPQGPSELRSLAVALNHLAARIDELLTAARENTADLAHRLRTPLTALSLEIESLPDSEERALLAERAARLESTLSELIHTIRARHTPGDERTDLCAITRERLTDWLDVADDSGRSLSMTIEPDAPRLVDVAAADLEAAIDALITNAFTHTPTGTSIAVSIVDRPDAVTLTVDDDGPGFPEPTRVRRGASGATSTGLGLDIARRTALHAGGALDISTSPRGGASVALTFPVRTS